MGDGRRCVEGVDGRLGIRVERPFLGMARVGRCRRRRRGCLLLPVKVS